MSTIQGLALLVVLLGGGLLGYKIGSWSLADARAQLEAIDKVSKETKRENEALRKRIDQELSALKAEHERAAQQLSQKHQAEKLALTQSLATTAERLSDLQAKRQRVAAEIEAAGKARESATGAHKEELLKKEQELLALQAQLESERDGLDCISAIVPIKEIRILNGQEQSQAERGQR